MRGEVAVDTEAMVRPVVERAGLELVEVAFAREGGRRVLRVTVDADEPLGHGALAPVSDAISRRLDLAGFDPGSYGLEVSTPGIEHPLRTPGQYRRAIGAGVRVRTQDQIVEGALRSADERSLTVAGPDGDRRIPVSEIVWARTVADWDAELGRIGP